jgi:P-type conjugative transfer protein TrbJ
MFGGIVERVGRVGRRAAVIALILLFSIQPKPLHAGVVAGIATEWTQIMNNVQLINSHIELVRQLEQQVRMYADMVRNTATLPTQVFGEIERDIDQLAGVVQTGRALAYSMGNLDGEFRVRFPGYTRIKQTWFKEYKNWTDTGLDTMLGTLKAAGLQGKQLESEQGILASLRRMASSTNGRMAALQVVGDIAEQQTQQLMKLRQIMLADLQSKQAYQAVQLQKEAATEVGVEQFFNYEGRQPDGKTFQGGWK